MDNIQTQKPVHVSAGALVLKKVEGIDNILILHRANTDSWHLPKGTQEKNETLEQTAKREVLEETGVKIVPGRYLCVLDSVTPSGKDKKTHYFIASPENLNTGASSHDNEHDMVIFAPIETAYHLLKKKALFEKEYLVIEKYKA